MEVKFQVSMHSDVCAQILSNSAGWQPARSCTCLPLRMTVAFIQGKRGEGGGMKAKSLVSVIFQSSECEIWAFVWTCYLDESHTPLTLLTMHMWIRCLSCDKYGNKICQAVLVFLVVIKNRGLSHPYSLLREGYISFWGLDEVLVCTETVTREAIECNWYVPAAVRIFFFFLFPSYISGVYHFWVNFLRMWSFF